MKVYVQKPWRVSDCSSYKLLKENPPEGIEYANMGESNLIQTKNSMMINNFLKTAIKKSIKKLYPTIPNAHHTPYASDYDLIHCEHCLSRNEFPWICNMEYVGQFWATGIVPKHGKKKILKMLKNTFCKKVITWTNWARDDIVREFPEIKDKVETVYPGIPLKNIKKIKKDNKLRLLFVSRRFYFKGGLYAVEVMDQITKKYNNVEGIVISDIPKEILEKYSKNKRIKFHGMVSNKKLLEKIYPMSDIFLYPSFTDTFGFAIIEAMSFGLPVVSVEGHSRKELIKEGKTGYVIESPFEESEVSTEILKSLDEDIVNNLKGKVEKLILNKKLRNTMSRNCKEVVSEGKFSIKHRNKRLKEIYLEALK